ncbi:hypothetical protein [Halobacteriovorax sp. DPLXC-1]|uniref:hypothetical protein n=1 Tax=Halobacteriovorax sp. DPLXC-1 TaxID=3110771 RepID=UPI002FF25460
MRCTICNGKLNNKFDKRIICSNCGANYSVHFNILVFLISICVTLAGLYLLLKNEEGIGYYTLTGLIGIGGVISYKVSILLGSIVRVHDE